MCLPPGAGSALGQLGTGRAGVLYCANCLVILWCLDFGMVLARRMCCGFTLRETFSLNSSNEMALALPNLVLSSAALGIGGVSKDFCKNPLAA